MSENDSEFSPGMVRMIATACIAAAAIFAYFGQSILMFVAPRDLFFGGAVTATGISGLWIKAHLTYSDLGKLLCFVAACTLIMLFFLAIFVPAATRSDAHDYRCKRIEAAMLSYPPAREDLPAIFEALRCRPQLSDEPVSPREE